jgi:malate permease and related proteins
VRRAARALWAVARARATRRETGYNVRVNFLEQTGALFGTVLVPVLLIVGGGALIQRFHRLDMQTLSKLQIYLLVPVFLFYYIYTSKLSFGAILGIAGAVLLAKACLAVPLWLVLRRLDVPRETLAVVLLSSAVFNAGNFGIPVAVRAFGEAGASVQAVIVMVSNLSLWGVGYAAMAVMTGKGIKGAILAYLKLPMFYLLVAAFALRGFHVQLPEPVLYGAKLLADGLVALALLTLGAQLALQARWPRWRVVLPVVAFKLLLLPVLATGVVLWLGLWPWPGAGIIVAAAGPTAVNAMLLAIEQKGDVELAAECVFWTTLLSALTVTVTLALVRACGGMPGG